MGRPPVIAPEKKTRIVLALAFKSPLLRMAKEAATAYKNRGSGPVEGSW